MDTIPKMEKGSKAVRKAKSNYSSLQKKSSYVLLWFTFRELMTGEGICIWDSTRAGIVKDNLFLIKQN